MKELTARQREVYEYLRDTDPLPTYREIGLRFGFTVNAAAQHVKALERKGFVSRVGGGSARSLWVKGRELASVIEAPDEVTSGTEIEIGARSCSSPGKNSRSGIMLVLTRQPNESILIDHGRIVVTVLECRSDRVRIGIEAPRDVNIARKEIYVVERLSKEDDE